MNRTPWKALVVVMALGLSVGCGTSRAFRNGEAASRAGDLDLAVEHFRVAAKAEPLKAVYRIALERSMQAAALAHMEKARIFEVRGDLPSSLREYRRASEFDPANRQVAAKTVEIERKIREQIQASRPKPAITELKERIRRQSEPVLRPASRDTLRVVFNNQKVKDILAFISAQSGIAVTYDPGYQDKDITVAMDGVTLEQALQQLMVANGLFYKVINERTILVATDNAANRGKYDDVVIRVFPVSNADLGEMVTLLNTIARPAQPQAGVLTPQIVANKTSNTITVRGTAGQVAVIERVMELNDKPRSEVTVDVEILEVSRSRTKLYGLNLSDYSLGLAFSPEQAPSTSTSGTSSGTSIPPLNLNSVSRGINTADFYLSLPSAVVRFLETDSESKLIAKPQLRGQEGEKLTLNLGDQIPVPSTSYVPILSGGTASNPFTSFNYRDVGVNLEITPKVTVEGDILLTLMVESSTLGRDISVAGTTMPSFGSRKVTTKLQLRDGESNLLAGLLREDERRSLSGFPGVIHVPILRDFFSANDKKIEQTDIVMLLTPRIVRGPEWSERDLSPIYIGTAQNPTIGGPPPSIGTPPATTPPAEPPTAQAALPAGAVAVPTARPTAAGVPIIPPGASPIPGMVVVPVTPPAQPAPAPPVAAVPPQPPGVAAQPPTQPAGDAVGQGARISVTPPGELRVGSGPYTVPITIEHVRGLSTLSLTLTFNPAFLRARSVQEGSFMRQGGATAAFAQQVDPVAGRVDITMTRTTDPTGASGDGLLAAIVFDAVAAGSSSIGVSGVATGPGGTTIAVQFTPASVGVK